MVPLCLWRYGIFFLLVLFFFFTDGCSEASCDFGVLVRGGELKVLLLCHLVTYSGILIHKYENYEGVMHGEMTACRRWSLNRICINSDSGADLK